MEESLIEQFHSTFKRIGTETSRKKKIEIFDTYLGECTDAGIFADVHKLLFLIYSGTVTYGISALPDTVVPGDNHMSYEDMLSTLSKLAARELTGKNAEDALMNLCNQCKESYIEVVRWCLSKDPQVGFGITSVNSCLEKPIPVFEQQKPLGLNIGEDHRQINWELIPEAEEFMVEVKYDGNRAYLVCPAGKPPHFLSANGHELTSMASLAKHIAKNLRLEDVVIDGELFYRSVEETGSIVRNKEDQGLKTGIVFYAIGLMTMPEWRMSFSAPLNLTNKEMRTRIVDLMTAYTRHDMRAAIDIQSYYQNSKCALVKGRDIEKFKFLMSHAVKEGFEGIVIKDCAAVYTRNKECRAGWWKVKFVDTYDATIVDFQEGTGKNKGRLGAFIVEYKGIRSNVGGSFKDPVTGESSLSDEKRLDYWINRASLVDKVIRVLSYGLTKDGKFRHASFINFHGEK